jgi:NADH:ubiquinone oxidoreductase subunit E
MKHLTYQDGKRSKPLKQENLKPWRKTKSWSEQVILNYKLIYLLYGLVTSFVYSVQSFYTKVFYQPVSGNNVRTCDVSYLKLI